MTKKYNELSMIIVPIEEWTWMAGQEICSGMRSIGYEDYEISSEFIRDMVMMAIDDALDVRSRWTQSNSKKIGNGVENYLDRLEWFDACEDMTGDLYSFIIEYIVDKVDSIIRFYIPDSTYHMWYLREIKPTGLYALEKGEDFRIMEYYRLKELYEPEER